LKGVHERQQRLSPDQYEIVDVRTARGLRSAMLIPKVVLKTLGAADVPFRDVVKPKASGQAALGMKPQAS
jgi:hypothetical protein